MALTEKLELLLTADPSQGISALRSFSGEAEKTAAKTTSSLQKISTGAMKIGAGGIGVGGFLTQMAAGDIEAANQLSAAIKQVGQSQSDYKDRIDATVSSQAEFGHTDEEVSKALTTLTLSYNDTGKALDQMQLVADLAARKNISLEASATMVAKAHGGAGKLFKEFGIQVQANSVGTKDYDGALTLLSQKLAGQASASADSFTGQLRKLRAEAENVVSEFGQNFGPAILGISTVLTALGGAGVVASKIGGMWSSFAGGAAEAGASTAGLGAGLATAGAAAAPLAAVLPLIAISMKGQGDSAKEAATQQNLYVEALKKTTGSVQDNVKAATLFNVAHNANIETIKKSGINLDLLADEVSNPSDAFRKLSDDISHAALNTPQFTHAVDQARASTDPFIQSTLALYDAHKISAGQLQTVLSVVGALTSEYGNAKSSSDAAAQAQRDLGGSVDVVGEAAKRTNTALEDMKKRYKEIETAADKAFSAALKLAPADIRVKQGALQISDAKARVTQAEQDLADAQKGTTASSIESRQTYLHQKDAVAALAAAREKLRTLKPGEDAAAAHRAVEQAYLDVQKANAAVDQLNVGPDPKKIADAQRALDEAKLGVISAVQDEATAIADLKETQDAANNIQETAKQKADNYVGALGYLNSALTGPTHDAINRYIWDTAVATNQTEALRVAAQNLATYMRTLAAQGIVPSPVTGMISLGGSPLAREAKAVGGPVMAGSSYLIGERGPELFTPGTSGYITPNSQMGGYTVNIGQIVTADPLEAGDAVARRLRIEAMLSTP